ncbi:PGF-CTERM-anchored ABC transporter substrate-binding protein [Natronorubrum thiooxidans]|uniref:Iron complex transport system substrate-binding protein n=1 Tax=Natronorubrum thiooxidans TaxID=308853 RepID=A0A1N7E7W6_9EURY|nr:PGF-CTERM-anchored ABC transporter substrate-binding protein [Natronorubrum thiooxidans]SIR84232.1 iron complex transport system substrate-binding protein [Natronorubrum thiooxidans]
MRQKLVILLTALLTLSLVAPVAAASSASATPDATADCTYPIELTDATGETITLEEAPDSIVALQPSDAQTVFEIGAEDRLVGMPDEEATSDLEMGDRVDVTDNYAIVHERVIDLDPDVVLAANITAEEDVETLREAGLTVYHFDNAASIDDVRDNVLRTGELTSECDGATETVDWMDDRLEVVETALEDADRPLAYYAMGEDGMTAGTDTFIHEVLTTAGVENLAERADIGFYQPLSSETIIEEDPEWIIYSDDRAEVPIPDAAEATTAYQNDNVFSVNANQLNQPAPQVIYAVIDIVETVHPDAYEQAAEGLDDADGTDESGDDETDDEDSIPGFGVPVAVAALIAVAFLARRR